MKKKIIYIAAIISCLSIITGGTFAYFTGEATARNVITAGSVEVSVVEQQLTDGTLQPYPEQPIPVMPGTVVSKIVSAQSEAQKAWVRMACTISIYDAAGEKMEISEAELNSMILITPDETSWTLRDGWWYCTEPVGHGEITPPLFESVAFSGPGIGNEYQNCTVIIDVTAQAVQQAHNGQTVLDAVGWPEI
jgi:predicted ribosomally synthesized peptide with SipW-like signal peptide